jgi:hypothetical protein
LLELKVKSTGVTVSVDDNPVAYYAFFCEQYNLPYNIVENTEYEVPNVKNRGYRLYRYAHEGTQHILGFNLFYRVSCDSYCGPCDCFGRILVVVSPWIALCSGILSIPLFFKQGSNNSLVLLSITVGCLLIPLCLLTYAVCYLKSFFGLVRRNFAKVPRSRVLSNMVWVPGNHFTNKHLEISGHVAAALKRGQLSYDQINDSAAVSSLTVQVGVALDPVKIMVYSYTFVEYLDNYREGFVKKVNYLVLTIIIFIPFLVMLVIASRR